MKKNARLRARTKLSKRVTDILSIGGRNEYVNCAPLSTNGKYTTGLNVKMEL
jgi:hypothetical protein